MVKSIWINGDKVRPRMNGGGASEWCMFDLSVVEEFILFVKENKKGIMAETCL